MAHWEDGRMFCECGEEIYYLKTRKGKFIPVNADSLNQFELDDCRNNNKRLFIFGQHIVHFTTCPLANKYRKDADNNVIFPDGFDKTS